MDTKVMELPPQGYASVPSPPIMVFQEWMKITFF